MKPVIPLMAIALLAGCATYSPYPDIDEGPPAEEGTAVALDLPVAVGKVIAVPLKVVEDSRCPKGVQCIQAGKLVVRTKLGNASWRETDDLTLGVPFSTHGITVTLASAEPERVADQPIKAEDYRFIYVGGD
jgi:hypothetical protein